MEEQKINWEVGQEVFCLLRGKGVVSSVQSNQELWECGVTVKFETHGFVRYRLDGKVTIGMNRSLFFSEPIVTAELFPPKKPFVPTLKKGDRVHMNVKGGLFPEGVVREVFSEVEDRVYISEDMHYFMKYDIESIHILGEELKFQ